jgi:hypothetical protein
LSGYTQIGRHGEVNRCISPTLFVDMTETDLGLQIKIKENNMYVYIYVYIGNTRIIGFTGFLDFFHP